MQHPQILYAIIIFSTVFSWDIIRDYFAWKKGEKISHSIKRKWIRLFTMASVVMLATAMQGSLVINLLFAWLLVFWLYWTLFDGLFNLIRNMPWQYPGSEDGADDAKLDDLQQKFKWLWIVKLIVSTVLLIIYICLL